MTGKRFDRLGKVVWFKSKDFTYHIHRVGPKVEGGSCIELLTKEIGLSEEKVGRRLFQSGRAPKEVDFYSSLHAMGEMWRVNLNGNQRQYHIKLRDPFRKQLHFPIGPNWAGNLEKRRLEYLTFMNTHWKELGGKTPAQVLKLGGGAFEVTGIGFAFVGFEDKFVTVQTIGYGKAPGGDTRLRWYLERGASIREALLLDRRQTDQLILRGIANFAFALAGAAGGPTPHGSSAAEGGLDRATQLIQQTLSTKDAIEAVVSPSDVTEGIMNATPNEQRIQSLKRQFPKKLRKLPGLH